MRILLVESNYSDAIVIAKMLIEASAACGQPLEITSAGCLASAIEQLGARSPDAVILDPCLPEARGLAAFAGVHGAAPAVPCLLVARAEDEAAATESLFQGAKMCLRKGEITAALLWRSLEYVVARGQPIRNGRSAGLVRLSGSGAPVLRVSLSERRRPLHCAPAMDAPVATRRRNACWFMTRFCLRRARAPPSSRPWVGSIEALTRGAERSPDTLSSPGSRPARPPARSVAFGSAQE